MATYSAQFTGNGKTIRTRRYPTREAARDALMKRPGVGWFPYLGNVRGDAREPGRPCEYAPRHCGAVSVTEWAD